MCLLMSEAELTSNTRMELYFSEQPKNTRMHEHNVHNRGLNQVSSVIKLPKAFQRCTNKRCCTLSLNAAISSERRKMKTDKMEE